MKTNSNSYNEEAGWEFTVPNYIASPFTWILIVLTVVALFLAYTLINKLSSNSMSQQMSNMPSMQSASEK